MLSNPEPDRNIEELNDDEIYTAIRYLEPDPRSAPKQMEDTAATEENEENNDNGIVICVGLYIAVLGCLTVFCLYLMMLVSGKFWKWN